MEKTDREVAGCWRLRGNTQELTAVRTEATASLGRLPRRRIRRSPSRRPAGTRGRIRRLRGSGLDSFCRSMKSTTTNSLETLAWLLDVNGHAGALRCSGEF